MDKWKQVVKAKLTPELKNKAKFQELCAFVFTYAQDLGKRNVDTDTALALWELLLKPKCGFFDQWKNFIEHKRDNKKMNVVTKDLWTEFAKLVEATEGDINNFEDDGAWPVSIDEFIEYLQQ